MHLHFLLFFRTNAIRWKFVIQRILEFIGCALIMNYIQEIYFDSAFKDLGIKKFTYSEIMLIILKNILPSMLYYLSFFYGVMHAWHNFFAEILMFSDREFYKVRRYKPN